MSTAKAALKAAKGAIDAHQYERAVEHATKVLQEDPDNYHANVFLGLAFEKQGQNAESATAYQAATSVKPNDPLAWQGLISLYEQQADQKLAAYHDAAVHLASLFMQVDDKTRCQTVIDKYTDSARRCGSRAQYKHSLDILLPGSDLYDYLEGRLPHPSYTYVKLSELVEQDEKERINHEIGQRRTRLGARIDQVTAEVKKEVLQSSDLETLYQHVVDWTDDEETRRLYEEKLLQHAYDTLTALPIARKQSKREQVSQLARGLVILKHPFALAWKICLEWKDIERIEELDVGLLYEYIEFFPEDGLGKVLRGYLESEISVFPKLPQDEETEDDNRREETPMMTAEDRLILMADGAVDSSSSVLALRLMGEYYLYLEEYESAVETARKAQGQLTIDSRRSGLSFTHNFDAVCIVLGLALVHYQAPRNHPEARSIFEGILTRKPDNSSALVGIGLIFEEQQEFDKAVSFLEHALNQAPTTTIKAEAAWCKALNGDWATGCYELEACLPHLNTPDVRTRALKAQVLYRIGMCIWNLDEAKSSRRDRNKAYSRFISSLQTDMNFAPAYTSLGIYYADYAKDRSRARKCFQKAFELSSSEVVAAERLAWSFAKTREWESVEIIAQRVVESGKVRPAPGSKKKGISWPFAALGVVQLNNQDFARSIVSFQSALRISPKDYYSWVGLGESYQSSGRYMAATKALEQAQQLEQEFDPEALGDTWFSKYMLANVKRELGEYDAAIAGYKEVLALKRKEYGVSVASLQTYVEAAWQNLELGFFGRAIKSIREALETAQDLVTWRHEAFNLWKSVGDLCSMYTLIQSYVGDFPFEEIKTMLQVDIDLEKYSLLADIDEVDWETFATSAIIGDSLSPLDRCCYASILAQKRAILCSAHDSHAHAVAWYNLGWSEHRAHVCQRSRNAQAQKRPLNYLKASVQCFKRAIELESGNAEFWNSLGVVTSELNTSVAQHSFVRSLYINEKNARVWTNLGAFYLIEGDIQLANDTFTRAQSIDPDYAQAWLGQGLLAARLGETSEARNLFTHAFDISDASATSIQRSYAVSILDDLLSSPLTAENTSSLLQPLLALGQLRKQSLADLPFDHIRSLLQERTGDYANASHDISSLCLALEAEYEKSDSSETLARFAQAKADLSRSWLAERDFDDAAENAETALALSADNAQENHALRKTRLSAHMSAGLAFFYQGSMDRSIEMFKGALEETQGDPDIICLLSQVLWAKGGEQERSVAREQLFDSIEKYPGHVATTLLLGVTAVLDDDQDTIDAVSDELQQLRTREDLSLRHHKQLAQLLNAIAALYPQADDARAAQLSEAATAVMLAPSLTHGWRQLAALTDELHPAEMATLVATNKAPPKGGSGAEDLSEAYAGTKRGRDAQKSIMLAPWKSCGWEALSQI
ncbi:MAG: hypothetical protein Q9219_001495 [cf. Caloplaca sp. 3 TL-2023]